MKPETLTEYKKYYNQYHKEYRKRNIKRLKLIAKINYHIKRERKLIAVGINGTMFLNVLIEKKNKLINL